MNGTAKEIAHLLKNLKNREKMSIERELQVLNIACERIEKATDGRISVKPYCDAKADGMDFGEDWGITVNGKVMLCCVPVEEIYSFINGMDEAVEILSADNKPKER